VVVFSPNVLELVLNDLDKENVAAAIFKIFLPTVKLS
jgi:hypothetical protein